MTQRFAFVSGCPRSGTTAMAQVLNWSDDAFIGLERFQGLINRWPDRFMPTLFCEKRLAQFEKGDCDYSSYDAKAEYSGWFTNRKDYVRAADAAVLGDKITNLYRYFELFDGAEWADQDVTVIHVIRNLMDVAASYQTRKIDATDSWQQDYLQALEDWSESVRCAYTLAISPNPSVRFCIVDYDTVFGNDENAMIDGVRAIFGFVGLSFGEKQINGMRLVFKNGEHRRQLRALHDGIRRDVAARVPADVRDMHSELKRLALA